MLLSILHQCFHRWNRKVSYWGALDTSKGPYLGASFSQSIEIGIHQATFSSLLDGKRGPGRRYRDDKHRYLVLSRYRIYVIYLFVYVDAHLVFRYRILVIHNIKKNIAGRLHPVLRPDLANLRKENGLYFIFSSPKRSTTPSTLSTMLHVSTYFSTFSAFSFGATFNLWESQVVFEPRVWRSN